MSTTRNMRPTTPNLKIARGAAGGGGMDPASPPQTPTSVSPVLHHHKVSSRLPPNIHPIGNSHQFSYVRSTNRFAQLSPQSSSEDEEDEDDDDDEEDGESDVESTETDLPRSSSEEEDDDDDDDEDEDEDEDEDDDNHIAHAPPIAVRNQSIIHDAAKDSDDDDDSEEDEDESDSDSDEEMLEPDGIPQSMPDIMLAPEPPTERTTVIATFTVEELSDFDPTDENRIGVIPPTSYEYPDSDRSRSRSRDARSTASDAAAAATGPKSHPHLSHRPHPDLDINMMHHLRNLNCSGSDEEDDLFDPSDDAAHKEFVLAQRELKMRKRRSHGSSIGKRTHSELSDSDGKDDLPDTPWDAVGASARRLRRRVGDRRSLQFQDPPPERIEELEEPESCEEEGRGRMMRGFGMLFGDGETLARELPYYAMEIMEMDEDE